MSYQVAAALAERLQDQGQDPAACCAIVTIGTNFPDAISVSSLASARRWPILLTHAPDGSALDPYAAQAMAELGITKAIKVGTYATLPPGVAGLANLSGSDRYQTNRHLIDWARAYGGLGFAHTGLATGDKFPDALASGPYLAKDNGILLLSPLTGPLPTVIGGVITANAADVHHFTFIACIEPVISQVKALLP
jgi:hypothetical protein